MIHLNKGSVKKEEAFYNQLGHIISDSGIADAFGISSDQTLSPDNLNVKKLIGFIAYHFDESVLSDDHQYLRQLEC